jgi:hypothetical protein
MPPTTGAYCAQSWSRQTGQLDERSPSSANKCVSSVSADNATPTKHSGAAIRYQNSCATYQRAEELQEISGPAGSSKLMPLTETRGGPRTAGSASAVTMSMRKASGVASCPIPYIGRDDTTSASTPASMR